MAQLYANPRGYEYEDGKFLLGYMPLKDEGETVHYFPIGFKTNRHAITFAGSGSGKGIGVICNNLMVWPHSALVIDPKGEAAEITTQKRADMGQKVYVLDPFDEAKVDPKFRASYNPLSRLDPNSKRIKEDIDVICDGLIIRSDPSAAHWDNGAAAVLAGLIAFLLLTAPPEAQNLLEIRAIIKDNDALANALDQMKGLTGCSGLCQTAHSAVYAKEGSYYVSNAEANTRWLDSEAMAEVLEESSFQLSDLKTSKATVYTVIPVDYLDVHGRFLRLFVRCAMSEMARKLPNGDLMGHRCVFFLDEFFSLGKIDEISKGVGTMRAYGLQLWPILQDLSQLIDLYGHQGAQTFFSNADIHQYFGNTDPATINHVSERFGVEGMDDMPDFHFEDDPIFKDLTKVTAFTSEANLRASQQMRQKWRSDAERGYETMVNRRLGKPRLAPDRVSQIIAPTVDKWAKGSFVFVPSSPRPLLLELLPWFQLESKDFLWNVKIPELENFLIKGRFRPQKTQQKGISDEQLEKLITEKPLYKGPIFTPSVPDDLVRKHADLFAKIPHDDRFAWLEHILTDPRMKHRRDTAQKILKEIDRRTKRARGEQSVLSRLRDWF